MLESLALRLNLDGVLEAHGRMMFFFLCKPGITMPPLSTSLFFNLAISLGTIDHLISCSSSRCLTVIKKPHSHVDEAIDLGYAAEN